MTRKPLARRLVWLLTPAIITQNMGNNSSYLISIAKAQWKEGGAQSRGQQLINNRTTSSLYNLALPEGLCISMLYTMPCIICHIFSIQTSLFYNSCILVVLIIFWYHTLLLHLASWWYITLTTTIQNHIWILAHNYRNIIY